MRTLRAIVTIRRRDLIFSCMRRFRFFSRVGLRSTPARPTQFSDDEFVVYRRQQQRMAYLVEFSTHQDQLTGLSCPQTRLQQSWEEEGLLQSQMLVRMADIFQPAYQRDYNRTPSSSIPMVPSVKPTKERPEAGLLANDGTSVPLKAVFVRAQLLGMTDISKFV